MENTALILIDIQNDYFRDGALELVAPDKAAQNAAQVLALFRQRGLPLVHIQHENLDPNRKFMLPGTHGQQINTIVQPLDDEPVIIKHFPNSFWQTGLEQHLRQQGIQKLVLTGMMTHMCVSGTARAGMERGFDITIVQDACATRALQWNGQDIPADVVHQTALAELDMFTTLRSTEQLCSGLPQQAA